MTGLNTVEPVSGVELLKNMADQNMIVFSDRLERLCLLLHYYDEENKKNGGPDHCERLDLNYHGKLLTFTVKLISVQPVIADN